MEWFFDTLRKYPELAIFLTLGLGYWIGAKKIFGFNLGAVTGTLLVGVLVGQLDKSFSSCSCSGWAMASGRSSFAA